MFSEQQLDNALQVQQALMQAGVSPRHARMLVLERKGDLTGDPGRLAREILAGAGELVRSPGAGAQQTGEQLAAYRAAVEAERGLVRPSRRPIAERLGLRP